MTDDMRFLTTDAALGLADAPEGWLSLGTAGRFLEPDAVHVLTSVVGLPGESADDRTIVATGRFRTYSEDRLVYRPVLLPASVWNELPTIDTIVDLLAPAAGLLIREAEEMLQADGWS